MPKIKSVGDLLGGHYQVAQIVPEEVINLNMDLFPEDIHVLQVVWKQRNVPQENIREHTGGQLKTKKCPPEKKMSSGTGRMSPGDDFGVKKTLIGTLPMALTPNPNPWPPRKLQLLSP